MSYISSMLRVDASDEVLVTFLRAAKDKKFLFGDDACMYLEELFKKGTKMQLCVADVNNGHLGAEHEEAVDAIHQLTQWFTKQYDVATRIFEEYLRIHDDSIFQRVRDAVSRLLGRHMR
jgi:hypothetical protein